MKVSVAIQKLRQMASDGQVLVKDRDGRWTRVEDVTFTAVNTLHAPTSLLIDGVRYVREDQAHQQGAA